MNETAMEGPEGGYAPLTSYQERILRTLIDNYTDEGYAYLGIVYERPASWASFVPYAVFKHPGTGETRHLELPEGEANR